MLLDVAAARDVEVRDHVVTLINTTWLGMIFRRSCHQYDRQIMQTNYNEQS